MNGIYQRKKCRTGAVWRGFIMESKYPYSNLQAEGNNRYQLKILFLKFPVCPIADASKQPLAIKCHLVKIVA